MTFTEPIFAELRSDIHARQHPVLTASGGDHVDVAFRRYADVREGGGALRQLDIQLVSFIVRVVAIAELRVSGRMGTRLEWI